jgi:uncharacterized protein (DUF1786 family)
MREGRPTSTYRRNGAGFLKLPKRLRGLRIVADNLSARKSADARARLTSKGRVHMHCAPTCASWPDQVEIRFNIFTCGAIRGAVCW